MITTPKGFTFAAISAGFKDSNKPDLALAVCEGRAAAAGVFTTNLFQAAPVAVGKEHISDGFARAVLINSGQANACTGEDGLKDCRATIAMAAKATGLEETDILPASTGVIGPRMNMGAWEKAVPELVGRLGGDTPQDFARAIMTTDAFPKIATAQVTCGDKGAIKVLGVAKGAGMICPNMATLLGVIFCDAGIKAEQWSEILRYAVGESFNRITVDGDTSTNDTIYGLASGASGVEVEKGGESECDLAETVAQVCQELAYMVVEDAEGGTKVMSIAVTGAADEAQAELAARAVGNSQLVKTAMFGRDPNWGRIVAALGRSGAAFDPGQVSVAIADTPIFICGQPVREDYKTILAAPMRRTNIDLAISLGQGPGEFYLLASDLSNDYVILYAESTT